MHVPPDAESWPIGAIVRELETALNKRGVGDLPRIEQLDAVAGVYDAFDKRLKDGADYGLWRAALWPSFAVNRRYLEYPAPSDWAHWPTSAAECARSEDLMVVWSAVALAPDIARREIAASNPLTSPIWDFMACLQKRLDDGLSLLPQSPASCAMAAAAFLSGQQNLWYRTNQPFDLEQVELLFLKVEQWLKVVDRDWTPGRKPNTQSLENERRGQHRLRPGHPAHEFTQLTKMLATFRPVLSRTITELDARTDRLLGDAFKYGQTAWLTARSRRLDEIQFQHRRNFSESQRARLKSELAFLQEFKCHLDLSNAARDAGDYLESARLLYLLYRLIPDAYMNLEFVQKQLQERSGTIRYLKEAGLEIDPRFETQWIGDEQAYLEKRQATMAADWETMQNAARESTSPSPLSAGRETGFLLRVRKHQEELPDWRVIMAEFSPAGQTPAGFLLSIMKGMADARLPASPEAMAASFNLALRYGYVRSAGKILARILEDDRLTSLQLLDFVHHVKRCTQLDPFGMRLALMEEWRSLILKACSALYAKKGTEWMRPSDRLWIHETITNRTHTQHRSLSFENAKRLYQKASGVFDIDQLRSFYDLENDLQRRAPGVADVATIARFCDRHEASSLGAPVAVSLMNYGDLISIVGVGRDEEKTADDVRIDDLAGQIARLISESEFWFKFEGGNPDYEIGWSAQFRNLANRILSVAASCDRNARVILLSMEGQLAQLPWQHLFRRVAGDRAPLVAILPSLSAFTYPDKVDPLTGFRPVMSSETGEEIDRVVAAVRSSTAVLDLDQSSLCIVVGHGSPAGHGELPRVRLGESMSIQTLDEWMNVLGARILVLHCCHSGQSGPMFMNEFGGVPGLGICLGTESILAPVCEVHASPAETLQECLFFDPNAEIGQGYRAAIERNPACCLYNLYGSPYETICPPTPCSRPLRGKALLSQA